MRTQAEGSVFLLGAGASADAGYPMSGQLLAHYQKMIEKESNEDEYSRRISIIELAKKWPVSRPAPDENIKYVFDTLWNSYENMCASEKMLRMPIFENGRPVTNSLVRYTSTGVVFTPYTMPSEDKIGLPPTLEGFFSFYDLLERAILRKLFNSIELRGVRDVWYHFRALRNIAVKSVYLSLFPDREKSVDYLSSIFRVPGPMGHPLIATLNFDLTIESLLRKIGVEFYDGFDAAPNPSLEGPQDFLELDSRHAANLWSAVCNNLCQYKGFSSIPRDRVELLKLHGSLGWFNIEQGSGDIGNRSDLRHNVIYSLMRLPICHVTSPRSEQGIIDLAVGGARDPVTKMNEESISRKAGAIWVRPNLIFAQATKFLPDSFKMEIYYRFSQCVHRSKNIVVIGYSWMDPHINDLIMESVARGARLVDISLDPMSYHTIGLLSQKMPTTFASISKRTFLFGGGAKRVFEYKNVKVDMNRDMKFDLIEAITSDHFPEELSLGHIIGQ